MKALQRGFGVGVPIQVLGPVEDGGFPGRETEHYSIAIGTRVKTKRRDKRPNQTAANCVQAMTTRFGPTVFRVGPFRFFFLSLEEPRIHIHVV